MESIISDLVDPFREGAPLSRRELVSGSRNARRQRKPPPGGPADDVDFKGAEP